MDYNIVEVSEHYLIDSVDKKDLFNEDSIILDCGACVGNFTQSLWDKYHCNFYLYEPDPRNFRQLRYRFFNKKINLNMIAISDEVTKKIFYTGAFPTAGSFNPTHRGLDGRHIIVYSTTLNDEISKFDSVDLVKLDIEGEEISVIPHLNQNTLKRIKQLVVEFHLQSEIEGYSKEDVEGCRKFLINNDFIEVKYEPNEGTNKGQEGVYLNENWII